MKKAIASEMSRTGSMITARGSAARTEAAEEQRLPSAPPSDLGDAQNRLILGRRKLLSPSTGWPRHTPHTLLDYFPDDFLCSSSMSLT